jgi:phosphatidylglycerophosphatase A
MMSFHKLIATVFGIGYFGKGGGTLAAFFCCLVWYYCGHYDNNNFVSVIITIIILILGIWSAGKVEPQWGIDSNKVVIDEVAGMSVTLLFVPVKGVNIFIGLLLFRFFDIVKPLFIKKIERLPGGWGVMMDDLVAGFYANIILQIVIWSKLADP